MEPSGAEVSVASPEEIGAGAVNDVENAGDEPAPKVEEGKDENENGIPSKREDRSSQEPKADEFEDEDAAAPLPGVKTLMPIRAPVSEDVDVEEDGGASTGSGESFDSALERMAESSTASFDTATSPRAPASEGSETARVMPKATPTSEDKQGTSSNNSSTSSTSGSDNDEDVDDVDNENVETGRDDKVIEEEDAPAMPVAKVSTEDSENEEDGEVHREDAPVERVPKPEPPSAEGLRVLGAEDEAEAEETKGKVENETDAPEKEPVNEAKGSLTKPQAEDKTPEAEDKTESAEQVDGENASYAEKEAAPKDHEEQGAKLDVPEVEKEQPESLDDQKQEQAFSPADKSESRDDEKQEEVVSGEAKTDTLENHEQEEERGGEVDEALVAKDDEKSSDKDLRPAEVESQAVPTNDAQKTQEPEDDALASDEAQDASEQVPETDSEEEDEEEEEVDVDALRAFARAAAVDTPSLGSAGPSLPARPSGTARSISSWEASRNVQASADNPSGGSQAAATAEAAETNGEPNDENQETREKLQMIRVKFLRLAQRLGQSAHNAVVAQVLYRLGLAEQLRGGRGSNRNNSFSFERASAIAEQQEAAGQEELDFTCTIMVLGKTGVGKSATINSLFDEAKTETNAFSYSTKKVQEITGTVHGIKLRVIDTPGLLPAVADQRHNEKVMSSVKRFIKKSPPDIVLYFDRLDMQSRDYGDLPLLRTITDTFGAAIWFNAIVVLTHASSAPPDGTNGLPLSYEMFVAQRSHVVQQTIRQAAGDMRLMNPVSLVENHSACRRNRVGERVLPNGQIWKPQLLLLCFASKILAEANSLLKLQESTPGKPFGMRSKVPPLPFLLSSLLQSRAPLKLPDESPGEEDETEDEMDEVDDSDEEEDYDDLPPFRRLTREELDQLDKKNRDAYFEELHFREKLFQKKQWKEELRRRKELRRRAANSTPDDYQVQMDDGYDDDNSKSAAVPVPLPDMALPPSFDSDNPTHRYRYLETASQWLVRPVLETHGWDHDSGYDGLNLEKVFVVANRIPASISGQVTKDKKEANLTMECAASMKHGEGKVSQVGFDVQTVGKDLSYTFRSDTRFNNFKKNKTIAGLALTMIGETLAFGLKLEDRLMIGKRIKVVMNGGALTGKGDTAYGGTVEISLRDKDFPIGRTLSTLGFSVMNWHGDMAVGGNLQSQFMVGRTMIVARGNLNNRGAGQITIKASSSEQLQMALIGIVPLVRALVGHKLLGSSQQM